MNKHIIFTLSLYLALSSPMVSGQTVVVSTTKMNILWRGIENPISIAVEHHPCSRIVATSNVGRLEKTSGCHYVFTDTSSAKQVYITVGIPSGDTVKWLSTYVFRQRKRPCPEIQVAASRYRSMTKRELLRNPLLSMTYWERLFIPDTNLTIASWSVHVLRNDTIVFRLTDIHGNNFPEELIRVIEAALPGDDFVFSDFVLSRPNPSCDIPDTLTIRIL